MILADTSIWVDHLGARKNRLGELLQRDRIVMHPWVVGELACGDLRARETLLRYLRRLPSLGALTSDEVVEFIDKHRVMGHGIGFIDVHLLATVARQIGTRLWSRDKRLAGVATELGLAFHPHDA